MDSIWKREEIESPCVKICVVDPVSRLCLGCGRSMIEISNWSNMSKSERKEILNELPARMERCKPKRRGLRKQKSE